MSSSPQVRSRYDHGRAIARALLRYVVVDLRAYSGALFAVSGDASPYRITQTELSDQGGDNAARSAWLYRRSVLLQGRTVRMSGFSVWPIFHGPTLLALLCLEDGVDPGPAQREHLATLGRLVAEGPPVTTQGWLVTEVANPHAAQIEAALAANDGVVTRAARMLGRPPRTLWDQIRRFSIDPKAYRSRRHQQT